MAFSDYQIAVTKLLDLTQRHCLCTAL